MPYSDQAEASTDNPIAASTQMRILIELQVLTSILRQACNHSEDLNQMRVDIAHSMASS